LTISLPWITLAHASVWPTQCRYGEENVLRNLKRWRWIGLGFVAVAAALALAACGGSSNTGSSSTPSSTGSTTNSTGSGSSNNTAQVNSILADATGPSKWEGPTSGPAAAKNKKLFILSVSQAASGAKAWSVSAAAAAKAIGWQSTIYDGQASVQRYISGMQQAMSQHYNAIFLLAIDPTLIKNQVAQARKAGIAVVDISEPGPTGPDLMNADIGYNTPKEAMIDAAAVTKYSDGKARIGMLADNEFATVTQRNADFKADIAKLCPGCKIVNTISIQAADLGTPGLASKIQAFLQANPSIDYMAPGYSDQGSTEQAIQQSGLIGKVHVLAYDGQPADFQYIKSGIIKSDVATPYGWQAWEAVDVINRIFHGQTKFTTQQLASEPITILNKNNLPAGGGFWNGGYDYQAKYKALWGVN
jgi:ribose transport system substrate-binding protein